MLTVCEYYHILYLYGYAFDFEVISKPNRVGQNNWDVYLWLWIVWPIGLSAAVTCTPVMSVFFGKPCGTQAVSFKCCVLVRLNQTREIGSVFEQRGNTNECRWRRARGGNARAHRPSSFSWCQHACQRTDRRRPANLLPFLSVTELNLSELPWGIAVWRRSHCYWWVNLQRTSYHVCVWRAVRFGWEHSVYLIEAAIAGLKFTEQWCVAFSKGHECFVMFFKKKKQQNLVSCLSSRDGVKMVD